MTLVGDDGVLACYYAAITGVLPEVAFEKIAAIQIEGGIFTLVGENQEALNEMKLGHREQAELFGLNSELYSYQKYKFKKRGRKHGKDKMRNLHP